MKKLTVIMFIVATASAALASARCFNLLRDKRWEGFREDTELYVRQQTDPGDVYAKLAKASRWPARLEKVLRREGAMDSIPAGHYLIPASSTATYCARMLSHGWQTPVRLTISETIRRRGELAQRISAQMLLDSASVSEALEDTELLSEFGATPETVFSLFIPDTYEVYWSESMRNILVRQQAVTDAFWTDERLSKASRLGLDRLEVTTLASIVDAETNCRKEMPKVAGVYINRLKRGMRLQADPTIAYCFDYRINRVLKRHLKVDSPYNTYTHKGLPPAPIRIATREALDAVLDADTSGGILYFCADPSLNGTHRFTRSYSEHMKNAREFQKALNNLNK